MIDPQIREDLEYVSRTLRRNDRNSSRAEIFVFWAFAILIGFALPDFAPQYAGWFWFIVGPVGGAATAWYASWREKRDGVINEEEGKRWGLHMLIGGVGYVAATIAMIMHQDQMSVMALNYLLVTGLVYALAGVHLDRGMFWPGLLALAGYAVLNVWPIAYVWTATGALMCLAMLMAAYLTKRARA